jgi:hypothetical protein
MKLKIRNLDPLTDLHSLLKDGKFEDITALELAARIRRAELFLETLQLGLKPEANTDFKVLQTKEPGKDRWLMAKGRVAVTKYMPRSYWEYPADVVKAKADLEHLQKTAQLDGTAKKMSPTSDTLDTQFALTTLEDFG